MMSIPPQPNAWRPVTGWFQATWYPVSASPARASAVSWPSSMPVRTPYSASKARAVAARSALPGPPQYPFTDSSMTSAPARAAATAHATASPNVLCGCRPTDAAGASALVWATSVANASGLTAPGPSNRVSSVTPASVSLAQVSASISGVR